MESSYAALLRWLSVRYFTESVVGQSTTFMSYSGAFCTEFVAYSSYRTLSVILWSSRTRMNTFRSSTRFCKVSYLVLCSFFPITFWDSSWCSEPFHILTLNYIHLGVIWICCCYSVPYPSYYEAVEPVWKLLEILHAFVKLSCLCSYSPIILWGSSWCTKLFHFVPASFSRCFCCYRYRYVFCLHSCSQKAVHTKGGGAHTRLLVKGVGESQFGRLEK